MPVKKKNLFLRERRCIWFRVRKIPERFQKVATAKLLPMLSAVLDQGYKKEQKRGIAIQILHHLATTEGEAVADSRDNSKQIGFRSEIWDEIVRLELAIQCKGSKQDGFITRYMATEKLLTLFKEWKYSDLHNAETERNTEMKQPTWDAPVVLTQRRADKKKGKKSESHTLPSRTNRPLPAQIRHTVSANPRRFSSST